MSVPLISIVIANYNYGRFLEEALKSVIGQGGFDQCELIIVDGGSTDNSVEIIKKYADKISWWCSEKDKGQSDAFNKGFAHARGRLGCWVNADDVLLPNVLESVIAYVNQHPSVEWITGGTVYFTNDNQICRARIGTAITEKMHEWVDPTVIGGPSSFFSIMRLKDVGGFNINLRYTMDCDLWNRFFAAGLKMVHIPMYFWGFRVHAESKTSHAFGGEKVREFKDEDNKVFKRREYSAIGQMVRVVRLKLFKILNGCALRSYLDTMRLRGRSVMDEFRR